MAKVAKIIILLLIIAFGGFLVYKFMILKKSTTTSVSQVNNSAPSTIDKAKQQEFTSLIKNNAATDQDLDGIPDSLEAQYKTSPTSSDTDNDGLTDWQEINIYHTDPLKADTDGDGYPDGYEVHRGFNPKGSGKLQIKNQ